MNIKLFEMPIVCPTVQTIFVMLIWRVIGCVTNQSMYLEHPFLKWMSLHVYNVSIEKVFMNF